MPKHEPELLHLRHSSMQFSDDRDAQRADIRRVIPIDADDAPDVIGFTELGDNSLAYMVSSRAEAAGYLLYRHVSVALAIHPRNEIRETGRVNVLPARKGPGRYRARGIAEVTFRTPAGNVVTVHEAHWITGYRLGPGGNPRREADHEQQTAAMVERVQLHGKGRRLAFWMGDTNVDEEKDDGRDPRAMHATMTRGGLLSIYDALDMYPPTHGRDSTIDIIGHYAPDARVTPVRVDTGPRGNTPKRHADHRVVDAWYSIRPSR